MECLTEKFDESQLDNVERSEIVTLIVTKMLYSSVKDTYVNALKVLVNLTDVHSEKGGDIIIKYDESCNQQSGQLSSPSILARLYQLQAEYEHKRTNESDDLIDLILSFYLNVLGSDDHNVRYFISNDLMLHLTKVFDWNSPDNPMHSLKIEFRLLNIVNNLVCS